MTIRVKCPNPACGKDHSLSDELAGKTVRCSFCQHVFKVPLAVPAPQPPDPLIGKQIAHYRIESLLGKGGMGKVYKARNINLNKTCAIKILPPEFATQDRSLVDRFIREARSAAGVEHPNVLPVHFVGKVGENYFIEMQYVDGGTLQGLLCERGRLEATEAARIVRDVASALEAAHEKGIIHRDIKPSNVMLTKKGQVFVADFGLAKVGMGATALTQSGWIMGTPLYMSPEQCQGKALDHRNDIYSLGVMFYEMLAGRLPYEAEDFAGLVAQHLTAPVPDIRAAVPGVPDFIAAIIMKMMAKRPEERYQNCGEIVTDLNAYLANPSGAIVVSDSTFEKAHEARRAAVFGKKKRSPVPIVLGLVLVLVVLGAVVFYLATEAQRHGEEKAKGEGRKAETTETAETAKPPSAPSAPTQDSALRTQHLPLPPAVAVAPKPETPSPKPEAPRPVVAVLPKPETPAPKPEVDLIAYYDEVKAVNELTDKYDYESVSARANLLKDKYAELIQTKLSNIERIVKLRKRCIERVNSGAVKVSMGDVSKRYAFAGDIKSVDEQTITATIKQKWSDLSKEEIANFYRKAADSNNADDLIGIAAFLIEGSVTGEDLDSGLNMLGKAKGLGADVSAYLKYIETLKQAAKEFAQAEAKGKAVEGEGRKAEGEKERRSEGATGREGERAKETAAGEQGGGGAEEKKTESAESAKSAEKSYDDVYVTTAATGDKIPHPLSKKTYPIRYMGRTIKVPEGMVYVPPGQFTMGEGDSEHKVYLDAFFIGKYEVTNAEWKAFVDATEFPPPRHWKEGKIPEGKENHPVLYVSWQDIQQYCEWVTKETGRETKLPTEAQWEKAARGPKAYIYPWGNQWNPTSCNWQGTWASKYGLKVNPNEGVASDQWTAFAKSEKFKVVAEHGGMTLPVGSFPKGRSFYGSHDMAGNAYEWCEDWFMTNYFKLKDAKRNPEGPSEEEAEEKDISGKKSKARLLRGECWISSSGGCRAVNRDCAFPSNRSHRCGFRMAVSLAVR